MGHGQHAEAERQGHAEVADSQFRYAGSAVLAAGVPELGIGYLGVALAFGLSVLTMAYAIGPISGAHLN
ncbi:aquaporin, partial [Pseudomonas aeruginosa]